jgi:hypothetical protein
MKLVNYIGENLEENFSDFDLTEIKEVLDTLAITEAFDLSHVELLQQQALRGADIISEYLGKIIKTTSYLESKVNSTKNKASLEYVAPEGTKTTAEMRKWAGECAPEVEDLQIKLAKAKAAKVILEKKYEILIKSHHAYKDIAAGLKKTLGSNGMIMSNDDREEKQKATEGWE